MRVTRRTLLAAVLAMPAGRAHAVQDAAPRWPGALWMATGRPGGAYDVYGPAWGRFAEQSSGVTIAYRASGGAAADILLIEQGAVQLGMTTVTVGDQARSGTGAWTAGVKMSGFRALFPMFPSILQIVTPAGSGITSIAGLDGKTVGVGPDGGSGAASVPAILSSLGLAPQIATGDYAPQIQDMLAGKLAACAFIGAPPMPAIAAAARGHALGLIGFTPAEAAKIQTAAPGVTAMDIPAGTFPRQAETIASAGTANFAIGAATLPDSLASAITLAALRNRASLASLVPAAATQLQPMLAAAGQMTFHPGAASALRSLGLQVDARFVEG